MKIVIDVDEKLYKAVIEKTQSGYTGSDIWIAVANGTPLLKGHGRLIDADKYRHEWIDTFDSCYGDKCSILFKTSIDNALTVIEADK